jgi:hydroxypyruvate isomerase
MSHFFRIYFLDDSPGYHFGLLLVWPMFSRRDFGWLMASALAAPADAIGESEVRPGSSDSARFSVMMWTLKDRGSFEENLAHVARAGYGHVELVGEFDAWSEGEWTRILARMKRLGLTVDATSGMKLGFADPAGGDAFLRELKEFLPKVRRLGCGQVILLSGKRVEGSGDGVQRRASVETLKRAAELLDAAAVTAVIEPIDRLENPPIYLDGVSEGYEIVRAVGSARVKLLYDLYHEQRGLGNLIEKLEKYIDEVGLLHVADVPGRHEPGTGEVNYGNIFRKIGELRYMGVIGMEFYPTGDVVDTLRRAREDAVRAMV